jgi:O-antigen ligase
MLTGLIAARAWPDPTLPTFALVIGSGLVVLRWPSVGVGLFVGVAALLPFAVLPVRLVFAPTLVDVTLGLLLVAWVLRILGTDEPFAVSPIHVLLGLFAVACLISLILGNAIAPVSAADARLFLKLLSGMLLFVGVVQVIRRSAQVDIVLRIFILTGTTAAAVALAIYALPRERAVEVLSQLGMLGYPTGADVVRTVAGTETVRAIGSSVDPNVLGALLMLTGLVVLGQIVARRPLLPRWLLVVAVGAVLSALALTYSRSAWVGLAAGFLYLALTRERRLLAVGAVAIGGLLLLPQTQAFVARFAAGLELRDQATLMRLDEYRNALTLIAQYPAFGIGFGESPTIEIGAGVSSLYLLIAEQTGLVGLALFLALIVVLTVFGLTATAPREDSLWGSLASLQTALVGALVAGFFDHYFFNLRFPHMVALFWLFAALLWITATLARHGEGNPVLDPSGAVPALSAGPAPST